VRDERLVRVFRAQPGRIQYLETRDLGASLAIEFTDVLARARHWASAATKYLVYLLL